MSNRNYYLYVYVSLYTTPAVCVSDINVARAPTTLTVTWTSNIPRQLANSYGFELDIEVEKTHRKVREAEETHQFSGSSQTKITVSH